MASALQYCVRHNLIKPQSFITSGLIYESLMGSESYGCSKGESSDIDIYGVTVPGRQILFPHTSGWVQYFDRDYPKFECYQQHHVKDESSGKQFDFSIFNIAHFFHLLVRGTPNCIDSLFTREECVKHITHAGQLIRDNRKLFLSKECWKTFRGYSVSQSKMIIGKERTGARKEVVDQFGYDLKAAYQAMRLLIEAEDIITTGDLDLMRGAEEYRAIRRGDWTYDKFLAEFNTRKIALEEIFHKCQLPEKPDKNKIRELLLEVIECHYGRSLTSGDVVRKDLEISALREIDEALNKVRNLL